MGSNLDVHICIYLILGFISATALVDVNLKKRTNRYESCCDFRRIKIFLWKS